jgi:hypothetical protein
MASSGTWAGTGMTRTAASSTLFCAPKDLEREIWDGYRLGPEAAPAALGVQAALPTNALDAQLPRLLENRDAVWFPFAIHEGLEARVAGWCAAAGASYSFMAGTDTGKHEHSESDVSPDSYWWRRFQAGAAAAGAPLHAPSIFSAATDSRWVRMLLGIPCFGFSPMRNLPILLHDHDEYISTAAFLEGIGIYGKLIVALCESGGEAAGDHDAPPPPPAAVGT